MSVFGSIVETGDALFDLARDLSEWSQATFGTDEERGPIGALKHLEKEAKEAQEAPDDIMEYADCLILILDASRRAKIKPLELIKAAQKKVHICATREWPKPTGNDEPIEHIR